jgi:hypothetical protein
MFRQCITGLKLYRLQPGMQELFLINLFRSLSDSELTELKIDSEAPESKAIWDEKGRRVIKKGLKNQSLLSMITSFSRKAT